MDDVVKTLEDHTEITDMNFDSVSQGAPSTARAMPRPSQQEAEAAVRTLLRWAGDDPDREGLQDTPRRVVGAYEEAWDRLRARERDALSGCIHLQYRHAHHLPGLHHLPRVTDETVGQLRHVDQKNGA